MSRRDHLRALLQAGGLAVFFDGALSLVAAVDEGAWLWGPEAASVGFGLAVVLAGPRVAARSEEGTVTPDAYVRFAEVVAGIACLGFAIRAAVLLMVPWDPRFLPLRDASVPWEGACQAALAVVLLAGPGRVGRWIRETFGPIPKRD